MKFHKKLPNKPQMKGPRRNDSVGSVRARKPVKGTNTHCIDEGASGEQKQGSHGNSSTPHYVFSVGAGAIQNKGTVTLKVGGVPLQDVLIDSWATCNLMGRAKWEWRKSQRIQCQTKERGQDSICLW